MTKRLTAPSGKRIGRPTGYTEERGIALCKRIAAGVALVHACQEPGMPSFGTVAKWCIKYPAFKQSYALARVASADVLFDQMVVLADEPMPTNEAVQRARLRIDTRKWVVSKLQPAKYGDQLRVDGDLTLNLVVQRFTDAKVVEHGVIPHTIEATR